MKFFIFLSNLCLLLVFFIFFTCQQPTAQHSRGNSQNSQMPVYSLNERVAHHKFPRLANQLQGYVADKPALVQSSADWDLLVLDTDNIEIAPYFLGPTGIIREKNPYAVIITYTSAGDIIPGEKNSNTIAGRFINQMQPDWYMKDTNGNRINLFQFSDGSWSEMINLTTPVNNFMPNYLNQNAILKNLTDGIFYDWVQEEISWLNNRTGNPNSPIDIDNDGVVDSDSKLDQLWTQGQTTLFQNSRSTFPSGTIIMGNCGWSGANSYDSLLNGLMIEDFLGGESSGLGWSEVMRSYACHLNNSLIPNFSFIMANRDNQNDFQFMRFALCSALMFDGYFCFTNHTGSYGSAWWYDEYSVNTKTGNAERNLSYKGYLGSSLGDAYNILDISEKLKDVLNAGGTTAESKVWRRDFENGIVLVNPTSNSQTIDLGGNFKKITGSVDPAYNNGQTLNSINLVAKSGVIPLKIQ